MIGIIITLCVICAVLLVYSIIMTIAGANVYKRWEEALEGQMNPDLYPCKLLLKVRFNQPEESVIADFSLYESKKIVGIVLNKKRPPKDKDEIAMDDKPVLHAPAAVYQVGGHWLWKLS